MAVERLKCCENIVALSEELGVRRRLLYKWRDQLDPVDIGGEPPSENARESTLRKEVSQLKRLLGEKTLEADFFKGASQKVEARRQKHGITAEKASTTKPGRRLRRAYGTMSTAIAFSRPGRVTALSVPGRQRQEPAVFHRHGFQKLPDD
jgi:transposase-like protein